MIIDTWLQSNRFHTLYLEFIQIGSAQNEDAEVENADPEH